MSDRITEQKLTTALWAKRPAPLGKSQQFRKFALQSRKSVRAFEGWLTVWNSSEGEVAILAPTRDALIRRWKEITGLDAVDSTRFQRVAISQYKHKANYRE